MDLHTPKDYSRNIAGFQRSGLNIKKECIIIALVGDVMLGAVIPAAGLSSRMGAFKPLLKIDGVPAIIRVINTFRSAGVTHIAVVTGHNAAELEAAIKHLRPVILLNERYASTSMFESVKIGLAYFKASKDGFDRIFVTPADTPLFNSETVLALSYIEASVAIPVCRGAAGHPIALDKNSLEHVLNYTGDNGLKSAVMSLPVEYVEVNDSGVRYDMDTPEDYARILDLTEGNAYEAD